MGQLLLDRPHLFDALIGRFHPGEVGERKSDWGDWIRRRLVGASSAYDGARVDVKVDLADVAQCDIQKARDELACVSFDELRPRLKLDPDLDARHHADGTPVDAAHSTGMGGRFGAVSVRAAWLATSKRADFADSAAVSAVVELLAPPSALAGSPRYRRWT